MNDQLLHLFGDNSKKVLFLFNIETMQFDYLNNAVEELWKLKRETVLKSPEQLLTNIHPDDRSAVTMRYNQLLQEGGYQSMAVSMRLLDDTRKEIKVEAWPVKDSKGNLTHIAGEVNDITKESEYLDYLREFSRRKNTTLEVVAHDLGGPLSIVKSVSALLESEHQEKNYEHLSTYTKIISEAYENCLQLITKVLKDEHTLSPTVYVNIQRFDLVEKLRRMLHSYQVAKGKDYTFELITSDETIMVELDEVKLMQILNNLITNSIKFTEVGGKITTELKQEGNRLSIIHSDNGIGIPKDLQPHIFDRYTRASRPGLRGEAAHGVGMSIVRELVEVQGGTIRVESDGMHGTSFHLNFPLPEE